MIDNDSNVLKEVINVQKKIIEQLDTNITKLELELKHQKIQKNSLEKKYKKKLSEFRYINSKQNNDEKDREIEKLKNQVDNLISIMYDLKSKNTHQSNTEIKTEFTNPISNIKVKNLHTKNKQTDDNKSNDCKIINIKGMSLIDELKNKLKNSKYEVDMD